MNAARVAFVTGGNRGIGLAIARGLARVGHHVVLGTRSEAAAVLPVDTLLSEGLAASAHQLDVTDPASVVRAVADTANEYGRLDILVNAAAVAIDRGQLASSVDFEKVQATLDANLTGTWRCCAAAIPEMRKHRYGRIVNLTSHLGSVSTMGAGNVSYRVSKAGVNALTRVLAAEVASDGILVNAVSPGRTATRMAYGETARTPEQAAVAAIELATLPDDGPTGGLWFDGGSLPW
ncbi:SDR family NAD(P)-dependent oxidoreductase [Streptomyces sp. NPDC049881]|uniref:SDR family NAD(P)-dependent oxidoreductase n=1 Tax=Streptomyces sp. NPDC049881 TaxID=3155778 RepID=UPI003434C1EB